MAKPAEPTRNNRAAAVREEPEPAAESGVLRVGRLAVPLGVLEWDYSRASGPGGQNVNKVSSRAELRVKLAALGLYDSELMRLKSLAGRRVLDDGTLQIFSQESRSQSDNKRLCQERFVELLDAAQKAPRTRRATKPTKGSKRRRIEDKKQRGEIKKNRRSDGSE